MTEKIKLKLRPGQAKVQFLACKEEINDLFEKGHSMAETLEIIKNKKGITMSYYSFRNLTRIHFPSKNKSHQVKKTETTKGELPQKQPISSKDNTVLLENAKVDSKENSNVPCIITDETKHPKLIGGSKNTFEPIHYDINEELTQEDKK